MLVEMPPWTPWMERGRREGMMGRKMEEEDDVDPTCQ